MRISIQGAEVSGETGIIIKLELGKLPITKKKKLMAFRRFKKKKKKYFKTFERIKWVATFASRNVSVPLNDVPAKKAKNSIRIPSEKQRLITSELEHC